MAVRKSELVITCNAKGVQNVMNFLNEKLAGIKQRLQEINEEAKKNGWTDQLEREFKQLTQEATGIDNIINRNQETMRKYGEVMKDLAGSKLRDLKKALQEGKQALNKMTEDDPRRVRLVSDMEKIARQMKNIQASSVSMREAVRNLKDLGNVSFDKLTQGLDAINQRLTGTKLKDKDRTRLQGFARQYQAEIAYRQSQTAVTNRNVGTLNTQQLKAEQSALNSAMAAMSGVAGYEKYMVKYEARLKEVNQQLTILSEKERKAAEDAKRLEQTQQAAKTVQAVYRGQKVSLEDLQTAYKTLEQRATEYAGVNQAKFSSVKHQIDMVRGAMMELGAIRAPQTGASLNRIIGGDMTTASKDQLQTAQRQLQSMLAALDKIPEKARQAEVVRTALKNITTQLNLVTEAEKKAEAAAKELQAVQEASNVVQQVMQGQKMSVEQLTTAYKTLEAQAGKYAGVNPLKYRQTQEAMKMLEAEIKKVKGELLSEKEIHDRIANSGKYSVQQLQQAYNQLQAKLQTLHTNDIAAIKATQKQMKLLQSDINRATGQVSGFAKAWQTAKQNIMMYVGVFAIVNKIKTTISDLVTKNKELSDSMANIRKVSQWASADVVKLTENLAKIDTRNTITTLQNLAYQGAKLGIGQYGVEGLTGFVRAAEQVQTALGEDLQEDALPALAKMTEVMGLIPKLGVEQAMQKAGSAIYQLGATSTATGRDIVEFSKRIMGLANVSGVSADQLLGLSAASSTMAIMPEVGATAFNKLFNSIHSNTEGIAKAVGIAKEELEGLLYEGRTMDALVKVFEKMQTMSMKELEGRGVFKELGSDGARLTNVMITMANKVDMLKTSLQTANEAFTEGKAVINEYLIQQETAAAYFERAANIWAKSFVNPEGVDVVKQLAQEWYNVSYEMTHSATTMAGIKNTLGLLAEAAMTLIKILPTLVQLMMFYGVGSVLQGIVVQFNAIYRATTLAGTGVARFNALLKTNAIALAVTAVAMLITKMWELGEASKAAAEAEEKRQKIFTDAAAEALQVYNEQAKALNKYEEALKKSNSSEDERNEIIRQFKQEFGTYLEKLGIEINTYKDLESALHRVNKELKDKAYYETGQKLRESYVGDAKSEQTNALSQFMQAAQKYNIPTTVMEDIVEGKITDPAKAIQTVYNSLYGKQYGTNGKLNWISGKPYQYWVGDESNVRTTMPTGGATGWVMDKVTGGGATQTKEIYNAVTNLVNATKEVNTRENQVTKFMDQYAENYSPQISVEGAIANLKRLKELNEDKLNEGLNVLRDKWKEMSENDRKTERGQQIGDAIDQYGKQLRALRGEGYTPPPSAKELAKERADAKQAMRKEMQDAQEASTGIISKLEEYYRLQEAAINEARADGQLTEERAAEMVRSLNIMKNETLATARRAVTTGDTTEWDKLKQTILPAVLSDTSEVSRTLLDTIQRVAVDKLHADLAKFNGSGKVFDLDSRAFFDQMNAKAAGNTREAARLRAKVQNEVERALLQYQFVEQANKKLRGDLETMGIITETYEQWAKRMQEGITEKPDARVTIGQSARAEIVRQFQWDYQSRQQQPATLFNGQPNPAAAVNPDDERQLQQWFQQFATNAEWASGIPQIGRWLKDGEKYKTEIRQFYDSLLQIQQAARQQSEQQGPLAPLDEQALREGQQRLGDLFAHTITDEQAYRQMGNKFVKMGVLNFRYNIDNEQEARQWVKQFATDARGDLESWAQAFPKLSEWIDIIKRQEQGETLGEAEQKALEEAMPAIRNLFREMMNHADRLDKAMKDAFQYEREQQQTRFRIAGYTDREEQADKYYANQAKQQETGAGQTFAQQLGLGSIVNDPEVLQIQNRIYWRNEEVKNAYAQLEALKSIQQMRLDMMRENGASEAELAAMEQQQAQDRAGLEQLLADRQTALFDQTNNLVTKTMQLMQKRAQSINTLTKPIQDGAKNIGQKFGEMIRGMEDQSMTWAEIWHSMAQAVGDSIIDMMAQYAQNMIMEKMMNEQSREDAIKTASVKVPAGIASGAAETVGQLGWWGLALIPVIAAVLHGLLAAAFASNKQNDTSKSSVTKVKLASGMLTYDSGNVSTLASGDSPVRNRRKLYDDGTTQVYDRERSFSAGRGSVTARRPFLGADGHVYTATPETLPEGVKLVQHPIATTVNNQPALVAERGPEIVIGRRTTKRIQMAAPELLHAIQLIDRGYMPRLRTYDEGNVAAMAQLPAPQQARGAEGGVGSEDAQMQQTISALTQTVALLSSTVADLQRKGIPAHINKYGTGGLIDEVKSGLRFDARYNR